MSDPFLGQIVMFAGNFAPRGWAFCDGQFLAISQHQSLFSILGTVYGGDGRTTFALPDLRGRVGLHPGTGPGLSARQLGQKGGVEQVPLGVNQMAPHSHTGEDLVVKASSSRADSTNPMNNSHALTGVGNIYRDADPNVAMRANTVAGSTGLSGGGQPHINMPPFLGVHFIIAIQGLYPSRN